MRQTETTQALISFLDQPHKPDNAIQRLTDIDTNPYSRREIKYTKCLTKQVKISHDSTVTKRIEYRLFSFTFR